MRRRPVLVSAAVTALAAGGVALGVSTAQASIPSADGTIHACYLNLTGAVTIIDADAGQACTIGQTELDWNQQGVAGPQGAPGLSGVNINQFTVTSPHATGPYTQTTFTCANGQTALGAYGTLHAIGNGTNTLIAVASDGFATTGAQVTGVVMLIPNGWVNTDPINIDLECATTN